MKQHMFSLSFAVVNTVDKLGIGWRGFHSAIAQVGTKFPRPLQGTVDDAVRNREDCGIYKGTHAARQAFSSFTRRVALRLDKANATVVSPWPYASSDHGYVHTHDHEQRDSLRTDVFSNTAALLFCLSLYRQTS